MLVPMFNPDSSLVAEVVPSPNHGERVGDRLPDMILLHYTGMPEPQGALEWLCKAESKVSAHYYVFEDGRIVQCVPERLRAWHAGDSFWANDTDINSCSIGIEIANPGHDHNYPDFPARQIAAVTALCRGIIQRRQIPAERVLAHSDVAPGRKRDPGEKFPWRILHNAGVGHFVEPVPIAPGPDFTIGDRGDVVSSFQLLLAEYGYHVPTGGEFDVATRDAVEAFQRHFRPERVNGVVDSSTLMTLQALIDSRVRPRPGRIDSAVNFSTLMKLQALIDSQDKPRPEPDAASALPDDDLFQP